MLFVFEAPMVTSECPDFLLKHDRRSKIITRVSQNLKSRLIWIWKKSILYLLNVKTLIRLHSTELLKRVDLKYGTKAFLFHSWALPILENGLWLRQRNLSWYDKNSGVKEQCLGRRQYQSWKAGRLYVRCVF